MKLAYTIFGTVIVLGLGLLFFVQKYNYDSCLGSGAKDPVMICGNAYSESPELASAGKRLFKANCAACHKLDKHSTGPYLRNISERYTVEDIIKFIRNDFSGKIQRTDKDKIKCNSFPNLSDDDIKNILVYTN